MRAVLWLVGGVSAGLGVLTAANWGFGIPGGDIATQVSKLGFDGLPELQVFPLGWAALAMFGFGVALLVLANRTAWKDTGGY
jgi:hypothetical protein